MAGVGASGGNGSPAAAPPTTTNGKIAFSRPDENWETYSLVTIDPDGSHEVVVPGSTSRWSWVWSARDGRFLVSIGDKWARPAVVDQGGSRVKVLDAYAKRNLHLSPFEWSSDGTRLLIASGAPLPHPDRPDAPNDLGLYTMSALDGKDLRRVSATPDRSEDEAFASSRDGSWIFVRRTPWGLQDAQQLPPSLENERSLFAIAADGSRSLRLTPPDLNVFEWRFGADLSPDGKTIAFAAAPMPNPEETPNTLFLMNADGSGLHQLISPDVGGVSVAWSPDGRRLAFTSKLKAGPQVWVVNADGSGLKQLTFGADTSTSATPEWSPDGTALLFERRIGDEVTLQVINADGTGQRQLSKTIFGDFVGGYVWAAAPAK
jgi:hypothetical protein